MSPSPIRNSRPDDTPPPDPGGERSGHSLPEDSYDRRNRQAIAAREARVASRLRAVQHAYRTANERDAAPSPADVSRALVIAGLFVLISLVMMSLPS
jgi:hypothetical protein